MNSYRSVINTVASLVTLACVACLNAEIQDQELEGILDADVVPSEVLDDGVSAKQPSEISEGDTLIEGDGLRPVLLEEESADSNYYTAYDEIVESPLVPKVEGDGIADREASIESIPFEWEEGERLKVRDSIGTTDKPLTSFRLEESKGDSALARDGLGGWEGVSLVMMIGLLIYLVVRVDMDRRKLVDALLEWRGEDLKSNSVGVRTSELEEVVSSHDHSEQEEVNDIAEEQNVVEQDASRVVEPNPVSETVLQKRETTEDLGKEDLPQDTEELELGLDESQSRVLEVEQSGGRALPRIRIRKELVPFIKRYVEWFLSQNGKANETGGHLIGRYSIENGDRILDVEAFIDAGPEADSSPSHITPDINYTNDVLVAARVSDPEIGMVGFIHRHPGGMEVCSGMDKVADRERIEESPYDGMVFGIITIDNPKRDSKGLLLGNFKFNFYYMGVETDYEYVAIKPELYDEKMFRVQPEYHWLIEKRGFGAFHDLNLLKGALGGVENPRLQLIDEGKGLRYSAYLKESKASLTVILMEGGSLSVFLTPDRKNPIDLSAKFEGRVGADHVWIAQIVCWVRDTLRKQRQEQLAKR